MSGTVVVDVGNTRVKWGRATGGRVTDVASLPADPDAWQRQFDLWQFTPDWAWLISGVHPQRRDALLAWLRPRAAAVRSLTSSTQLPLNVRVECPEQVGLDRLLNAVAVNTRRPPETAAIVVDAGSAITVDLIDAEGAFRGGAILPGLRLMAQALHDHTAQLPFVEVCRVAMPPGTSTVEAIEVGVVHGALGGIERLLALYRGQLASPPAVFFTGGDAPLLAAHCSPPPHVWPEMTLAGLLHGLGSDTRL